MNTGLTRGTKFGTFGGVFTPCTLTILGVIMFLRFGYVVGQAGVLTAVGIVLAAKAITTLTSLSLSAIATNTRVKGGGAYYLISRSLGVEFGGAIGILFFIAQAVSVAMYVIGFTEAAVGTFESLDGRFAEVATGVNIAVFMCVYIGAGWTIRLQYGILAVLGASLASFYLGAFREFDWLQLEQNLQVRFTNGESVYSIFALFFPAVTGIMAGANMSGDLENPSRSIPRGTLLSILVTGLVYLSMTMLLGGCRTSETLSTDRLVIRDIAVWPVFITAGVFAATLSSALGSMMGAPRILQAFARDEVFLSLRFFGAGTDAGNEPRRATVLTFAIAQCCILLGDLNTIAPVITMFFMITYGLLNLATFYEAVTGNPSYRPSFRYCHWSMSLVGAIACLGVMFLINWAWAVASIALIALLHWYIRFREIEGRWGDINSGVAFERARRSLLRLEQEAYHPKNWRPLVLALSGSGWTRPRLAIYGHWLTAGHGILTLAQVLQGETKDHAERQAAYEKTLRQFIRKQELQAFPAVVVAEHQSDGLDALIQSHGIGGIRPNTVLLNWPQGMEGAVAFGASLRLLSRFGRSIVSARFVDDGAGEPEFNAWSVPDGTIDIWWRGKANGQLMLLLAHLLRQNPQWRAHRIRLLRVVPNQEAIEDVETHLRGLAAASRIEADVLAVCSTAVAATIQSVSASAAVVIVGFEPPAAGEEVQFFESIERITGELRRVLIVNSSGGMELET
jgi:amino acid transporter